MKIATVFVLAIVAAPTLAHPITGIEPRDISGEQQSVGTAAFGITKALTGVFRREPEALLNVRNFVYGDGLDARALDGELAARNFDDDLEARGFDEFEVRDIEDDLKARNVEDDLKAREFDNVLEARDLIKRGKGGKGGGGSRSQHHCGYKSCTKSKDKCTEHYWECSGEGTLTHKSQKVLIGKACESNCRDTADGELYTCGRKESDQC
ncbi:hypothetical protein AX14_009014 [Amanita brunnescens Koide BX004]|nr:hypothetical protein AX14_009014 [Amanita brunnescens Koide BX004]